MFQSRGEWVETFVNSNYIWCNYGCVVSKSNIYLYSTWGAQNRFCRLDILWMEEERRSVKQGPSKARNGSGGARKKRWKQGTQIKTRNRDLALTTLF